MELILLNVQASDFEIISVSPGFEQAQLGRLLLTYIESIITETRALF
jgi:hypothetical protein